MARRKRVKSDLVPYREFSPPAALSEWVECIWTGETNRLVTGSPVRPDGCIDIVYSRIRGLRAVGAMTVSQRYDHVPGDFHSGARFRPGMAREFLKVPAAELTNLNIPLAQIAGPTVSALKRRLDNAETAAASARVLAEHLPIPKSTKSSVQRAIDAITIANGSADLDRIASDANLSIRHFRRLCLAESGLTPKHLSRILRFRNALRHARSETPNWADIAVAVGYFDQSHLIRDFREFAGETPMAVFSNRNLSAFV